MNIILKTSYFMEGAMQKMIFAIMMLAIGFSAITATANLTQPLQTAFAMKIDTVAKMYRRM